MEDDQGNPVFSIGHSTLAFADFRDLLRARGVTALADVRSQPYSRRMPQFSRPALSAALAAAEIAYVHLGDQLGARPSDTALYTDGIADYEKIAETAGFAAGLDRVVDGSQRHRIALMCAERDPLDCHRCLLVGRHLRGRGITVRHMLGDGDLIGQDAIEARLLGALPDQADFFAPDPADRLAEAYRRHRRTR